MTRDDTTRRTYIQQSVRVFYLNISFVFRGYTSNRGEIFYLDLICTNTYGRIIILIMKINVIFAFDRSTWQLDERSLLYILRN